MLDIKDNHLIIDDVDTVELSEQFGTPLYVTDKTKLKDNFQAYRSAFPKADIYYAAKANWDLTILKILAEEGAGADVFSEGELYIATLAKIQTDKILFNGNSKTDSEIEFAIKSGVKISVDSLDELNTISKVAVKNDCEANIAFRINPDVSPDTHPKISTGLKTSKFGILENEVMDAYKKACDLPNVNPIGIHCHIGSQILDISVYEEATLKMMDIAQKVSSFVELKFIDLGGGLGINYKKEEKIPTPKDLADIILPIFEEQTESIGIYPKLILEPGRSIVGDTTILLSRVNTVKKAYKNFVGIDAGFNLLMRPVMYDSYHEVIVANKADEKVEDTYTIAGPICESGDIIGSDRKLPKIEKGDLIAVLDTGAYGFSMSSQYNGRPRCAEVVVCKGKVNLVREKETVKDLVAKFN